MAEPPTGLSPRRSQGVRQRAGWANLASAVLSLLKNLTFTCSHLQLVLSFHGPVEGLLSFQGIPTGVAVVGATLDGVLKLTRINPEVESLSITVSETTTIRIKADLEAVTPRGAGTGMGMAAVGDALTNTVRRGSIDSFTEDMLAKKHKATENGTLLIFSHYLMLPAPGPRATKIKTAPLLR